ncbi:hypothetical protein [Hyphomicrobium sp.]|uniref:hypothetical protein n=1 Tax=Hyphomicrobium sp. TaxID=82 RepID=UPI003566A44C
MTASLSARTRQHDISIRELEHLHTLDKSGLVQTSRLNDMERNVVDLEGRSFRTALEYLVKPVRDQMAPAFDER